METAATVVMLLVATAVVAQNPPANMPRFMTTVPKLDRAHKDKLLLEAPCTEYCKYVIWQYKKVEDSTWQWADSEAHTNFPDTFYLRSLSPDTLYTVRALFNTSSGGPYMGNEIPTLEVRTCPEQPPPVSDLYAHSAGPGWLDLRWKPPPKEQCKSHLYYQARYAPHGNYFSQWRAYGFFRSERWVHFRPTTPCAAWPNEFCMLVTDSVKAGDYHVVEVRVSRFDEITPALSEVRKLVVQAATGCIINDSCGVIGGAPVSARNNTTDDVDLDDADITTTQLPSTSTSGDGPSSGGRGNTEGADAGSGRAARRAGSDTPAPGDSTFGRLAPLFLALAVLACAALPAAFFWGKRRGAHEAVELHMVSGWRRRLGGDGGSQPVLGEEATQGDDRDVNAVPGASLQVDQHGRFSWAKLPPTED